MGAQAPIAIVRSFFQSTFPIEAEANEFPNFFVFESGSSADSPR
jgi:hypothetical protein